MKFFKKGKKRYRCKNKTKQKILWSWIAIEISILNSWGILSLMYFLPTQKD